MSYSIPDCFMIAFICGLAFGLVYEAFRVVRLVLRFKAAVFVCDVLFFILAAGLVFRLSMVLGNYVRIYTVMGFGAGVFAYIVTIGRVLNMIESAAAVVWRKTIGRLARLALNKAKKVFGAFAHMMSGVFGKAADFFSNSQKNLSKHLHSKDKKMYNKDIIENSKGSETSHVIQAKVTRSS